MSMLLPDVVDLFLTTHDMTLYHLAGFVDQEDGAIGRNVASAERAVTVTAACAFCGL